jgi:hypothetical protein
MAFYGPKKRTRSSATGWSVSGQSNIFVHEIGHIMGAFHNRYGISTIWSNSVELRDSTLRQSNDSRRLDNIWLCYGLAFNNYLHSFWDMVWICLSISRQVDQDNEQDNYAHGYLIRGTKKATVMAYPRYPYDKWVPYFSINGLVGGVSFGGKNNNNKRKLTETR